MADKEGIKAGKEPVSPLYTIDDVKAAIPFFNRIPYKKD